MGRSNISHPIGPVTPTRVFITKPHGSKVFLLNDNPSRSIYESNDYGVTWILLTTLTMGSGSGSGTKYDIEYSPLVDRIFVAGYHIRQIDPISLAHVPSLPLSLSMAIFMKSPIK
ncbi:MAG: hypothetical protein ACI8ZM_004671 [Crocinitomix sp.]|jgi:hypothetical protein